MYTKRITRSSTEPDRILQKEKEKKEREDWENAPFLKYPNKTKYYTTFIDLAMVFESLLKLADSSDGLFVVGFDLEWPFSFKTGPGKTAVLQISPSLDICHVFHIYELKDLPKTLTEFLSHKNVRISGVNIKNDCRKLMRDFPGIPESIIDNCIELSTYANSVLPFQQRWSMEKLVNYLLKLKINKDNKIRMSQWHVKPLSEEQIEYAAIDAYASLLLYQKLMERNDEKQQ